MKVNCEKNFFELDNIIIRAISVINEKLKELRERRIPNPLFTAILDFLSENCKKFKVYDLSSALAALICDGDRKKALEVLRMYSSARGIEF